MTYREFIVIFSDKYYELHVGKCYLLPQVIHNLFECEHNVIYAN